MNMDTPPGWWLKFSLTFISGAILIALYYWSGIEGLGSLILLGAAGALAIAVYFIPTIIARQRKHRQKTAIFVLNLFAGWTLIAWVVALVWAFTADAEK